MPDHPSRLGRGLGALLAPRPTWTELGAPDGDAVDRAGAEGATALGERTSAQSDAGHPDLERTASAQPDAASAAGRYEEGTVSAAAQLPGAEYREVPVESLRPNPRQPRTVFDDDALAELAASITQVGLLQPIVVREASPGEYEIVMGERRWRAAGLAGLQAVPVLVRDTAPDELLRDALLENLHRADLNPLDEAAAYAQLLADFGATHDQLAVRLGRSRAHVSNTLRLMQLPPTVQRRLAAGVLSAGHARAILAVPDPEAQDRLAARVVAEGLSVRSVEEMVAVGLEDAPTRTDRSPRTPRRELTEVAEALTDRWETRVRVSAGRNRGRLIVDFGSVADLERILAIVAPDVAAALLASPDGSGEATTAVTSAAVTSGADTSTGNDRSG